MAKKAYATALSEHLPGDIRDLLSTQNAHILASHDRVKALRDSKTA